jgi:AcrR family transcriptional regulator
MSDQKRAGGRPRDPQNDAAILRAALELLIERGPDGTSIEQVAKRAGVARLTVYRRFANKDELLIKAVESARMSAAPQLAALAELSFDELIDALALAMSQPDARKLLARLVGTLPDNPRLFGTYWEMYVQPRRALFAAVVERERDAGRLPASTDPQLFQDMVAGTLFYRLTVNPVEPTADQLRDYVRATLLQLGYRPDGVESPSVS